MKTADHGKNEVAVSSSVNNDECVMKSFIVPVTILQSDTKFPFDVLTLKYTILRPQTPVLWLQKKSDLCSVGGRGGEVSYLCERQYIQKMCELIRWPLKEQIQNTFHVSLLAYNGCIA